MIPQHKNWQAQCEATTTIRQRYGPKSALDYIVGEKLLHYIEAAGRDPEFASELPRFLAAVWGLFNQFELTGYIASLKRRHADVLRHALYIG